VVRPTKKKIRVALKKQYLRSKLKVRWDVTATHGLRVGKNYKTKPEKKRQLR